MMAILRFQPEDETPRYPQDCYRIVTVYQDRGYLINLTDAERAWLAFSDKFGADWAKLPASDDNLFMLTRQYFKEF